MVKASARWLVRKFWGTLALVIILTAALVQMGREFAPSVSTHREWVADYLSEHIDGSVHFGGLALEWKGLRPRLVVKDLDVQSDSRGTVLSARRVEVELDLMASLTARKPTLGMVDLKQVDTFLEQSDSGVWGFAGMNTTATSLQDAPRIDDPLDLFLLIREVRLTSANVHLVARNGAEHHQSVSSAVLENEADFHRLTVSTGEDASTQSLRAVFEGRGDPRDLKHFQGMGHVFLQGYPVDQLTLLPEGMNSHPLVTHAALSAQLWLQSLPDSGLGVQGLISYRVGVENTLYPQKIEAGLQGSWQADAGWQLGLSSVELDWPDHPIAEFDVQIKGAADQSDVTVLISRLSLEEWQRGLLQLPELPQKARDILADLDPQGELAPLKLTVPMTDPETFRLQANLSGVSLRDWKDTPQVKRLSGYVDMGLLDGVVTINSPDGFFMHFPRVYDQPFELGSAQGRVAWRVDVEANQVLVNSGQLHLRGSVGDAIGYFYLDAPLQRKSRETELILQIGLRDAVVQDHKRMVPNTAPESLRKWLAEALVSGGVPEAGFVLRSEFGLGHSRPAQTAVQLALRTVDATLKYHPDWPQLTEIQGHLLINDRVVNSEVSSGRLLEARLEATQISTELTTSGGTLLNIEGRLQGGAQTGLDLLTTTPVRQQLGKSLDDWHLTGQMFADVDLSIPLSAEDHDLQRQRVQVQLDQAALTMEAPGITIESVVGSVAFSEDAGLSSSGLSGQLWGEPIQFDIASRKVSSGVITEAGFSGPVRMESLKTWGGRPELGFLQGKIQFQGAVLIAPDQPVTLRIHSDLQGVDIMLPEPFGKMSKDSRAFELSMPFVDQGRQLRVDYSGILGVAMMLPYRGAPYGHIALGETLSPKVAEPGVLNIEGHLPRVDAREWWGRIQEFGLGAGLETNRSEVSSSHSALQLDVSIDSLVWGDVVLDALRFTGEKGSGGWRLSVEDDRINGDLIVQPGQPIRLNSRYIRWDLPEGSGNTDFSRLSDLSDQIFSKSFPGVVADLKEVTLNGKHYGAWTGHFKRQEGGYQVANITGEVRGLKISGLKGEGAVLAWRKSDGVLWSSFKGRLHGKQVGQLAQNWDLPVLLDAETMTARLDVEWPGSPLQYQLIETKGVAAFKATRGNFHKGTGQATSALLRLLGLFNFDSWVRRLKLDFSDVYESGTPFENLSGEVKLDQGMLYLTKPIVLQNTSSKLEMGGKLNLSEETIDASLVATLPVGGNATLFTALAAGLPAAAGVYVISKLFKKHVDRVASISYTIEGNWGDPEINFDSLFDDKSARNAAQKSDSDQIEPLH